MPQGFFTGSELAKSKKPEPKTARCGACKLYKSCQSPKMPVTGNGRKGIMVVGEAPGATEDKENEQFVGSSGQLLRKQLNQYDIDLDEDCWKHNALVCRPPDNTTPTIEQIQHCLPNVKGAIKELKPKVIITLGASATISVLSGAWTAGSEPIGRWAGMQIPLQMYNAWVCPTWYPAYIARLRQQADGRPDVTDLWWDRHLEQATELQARPWDRVPNYADQVEVIHDPNEAAKAIRWIIKKGGLAAFDYETNALRPETKGSSIICASISLRGKRTITYPWHGEAIRAHREFLISDLPKIAANLKFEERWSKRKLGVRVRRWVWDTMLGAHLEDNRKAITGLKFQALVQLGQGVYNEHIESFLSQTQANGLNRIHEVDKHDLMLYCGMDSLLCYLVGVKHMKSMGYTNLNKGYLDV